MTRILANDVMSGVLLKDPRRVKTSVSHEALSRKAMSQGISLFGKGAPPRRRTKNNRQYFSFDMPADMLSFFFHEHLHLSELDCQ